jgi:hypothetical protein
MHLIRLEVWHQHNFTPSEFQTDETDSTVWMDCSAGSLRKNSNRTNLTFNLKPFEHSKDSFSPAAFIQAMDKEKNQNWQSNCSCSQLIWFPRKLCSKSRTNSNANVQILLYRGWHSEIKTRCREWVSVSAARLGFDFRTNGNGQCRVYVTFLSTMAKCNSRNDLSRLNGHTIQQ